MATSLKVPGCVPDQSYSVHTTNNAYKTAVAELVPEIIYVEQGRIQQSFSDFVPCISDSPYKQSLQHADGMLHEVRFCYIVTNYSEFKNLISASN